MKNIKVKLTTKIAIATFLLSILGISIVAFISYKYSSKTFQHNLTDTIGFQVEKLSLNIKKEIEDVKKDLLYTSKSDPIAGILRTTNNKYNFDEEQNMDLKGWNQRLEKLFRIILSQNPSYFQIRLIGIKDNGKELLRVENTNNRIIKISQNHLQSKYDRTYYKKTIALKKGEIYISKIDLNKEHGIIQTPYTPTIRVSTPIYKDNTLYGMIVININLDILLKFQEFKLSDDKTFIANKDGYYIYHNDMEKRFGFEFGKKYLIQNDFPISKYMNNKTNQKFFSKKYNSSISIQKVQFSKTNFIFVMKLASNKYIIAEEDNYLQELWLYIFMIAIIIALLNTILVKYLITPIHTLTAIAKQITNGHKIDFDKVNIKSGDEIEDLATAFEYMISSISTSQKELENLSKNLEIEVETKTKELQNLNENLEIKIKDALEQSRKKDNLLQQQSKMAAMGEMIGAIAHQWRQPLNAISISIQNLKYDYKNGEVDDEFIATFIDENKTIIKFMSQTIDDFRNFFRVDKEKIDFDVKETIDAVLSMQKAQLTNHNIDIEISENSFVYNGLKSEFQQVILNLINNAKDALLENNIKNPKIKISIKENLVSVEDNAKGIPDDILDRVFEPYFTTKEQGKGTGMGLYMSKMIIEENMGSKLDVKNTKDGAMFIISLSTPTE